MGALEEARIIAKDWLATTVIGFLVTSYWRGTWTLFDVWLCDQPDDASLLDGSTFCFAGVPDEASLHLKSGWISCGIGWGLTLVGIGSMWVGLWRPELTGVDKVHITPARAAIRFLVTYTLGMGAVNLWRGVWYLTDYYLLPNKLTANDFGEWPLTSFWVSSVVGSSTCFLLFAGASILAPPAILLIDGPGVNPPPMAVTIVSSYYSLTLPAQEKPPQLSKAVIVMDVLISFIAVPIMVVWFWRGSWLVVDFYLWGFSPEPQDLHLSLAWSFIIALGLMVPTSETVFAFVTVKNPLVLGLLGKLRTWLLAWGTVNFWRVVWYIWDEFLGGTTQWSAWISHAIAIVCLTAMGCLSCIVAPASTLGVDAVPHPDCADEPLFHNLPVPMDDLYVLGIGRQPQTIDETTLLKDSLKAQQQHIQMSMLPGTTMHVDKTDEADDTEANEEIPMHVDKKDEADDTELNEEIPTVGSPALETSIAWSSGGTGRHPSYSSVRAPPEDVSRSYFDLQRPDLDRRISLSLSITSLQSSGISTSRRSSLCRSR